MYSSSQRFRMSRTVGLGMGRVVVADPDESVFSMVRQLTAPDCWEVRYASTASEVQSLLRAQPPVSLVIVELPMLDASPGLCDELVARSRRGLRVVITTDAHNEASERRARLIGPVYYAPKPLHVSLLHQVLDGALCVAV